MEYKQLKIVLYRSELISDIEEIAFITADSLITNDEKVRSSIQDVAQDGRIGRVTTCLNRAWGELLNAVSGYLVDGMSEDMMITNDFKEPDSYSVTLRVPTTFNITNRDALVNSASDYLVNKAIGYFFAIVKKDEAQIYLSVADQQLIGVKKYLSGRVGGHRIKMSAF